MAPRRVRLLKLTTTTIVGASMTTEEHIDEAGMAVK
jgi:hypothetical protein